MFRNDTGNWYNKLVKNCNKWELCKLQLQLAIRQDFGELSLIHHSVKTAPAHRNAGFLTLVFHKVMQRRACGVMDLLISLLQISWRVCQWRNFENRSIFDKHTKEIYLAHVVLRTVNGCVCRTHAFHRHVARIITSTAWLLFPLVSSSPVPDSSVIIWRQIGNIAADDVSIRQHMAGCRPA